MQRTIGRKLYSVVDLKGMEPRYRLTSNCDVNHIIYVEEKILRFYGVAKARKFAAHQKISAATTRPMIECLCEVYGVRSESVLQQCDQLLKRGSK